MLIAGVDEAGRGPLVGSVVAAAVILNPGRKIIGLKDSKQLTATRRNALYIEICQHALAWGIGLATAQEIDEINILQATFLAMQRAVEQLKVTPSKILIDGNMCPRFAINAEPIVGGDRSVECISAASILAKVTRDNAMLELDAKYPQYGFAQHKGYPTKAHVAALQMYGPCAEHRFSYRPVQLAAAIMQEATQ